MFRIYYAFEILQGINSNNNEKKQNRSPRHDKY